MAFGTKKDAKKDAPKTQSRMSQVDDEQVEGFEAEADAYEVPPPVSDGEHIVEVKLSETKQDHGEFTTKDENGAERKHFFLSLVLTIIGKSDPEKGRVIFDTPNTMPRRTAKGVTTAVATLIRRFGGKATGRPFTDIQTLKNILSKSVPKAKVTTRWEATYDKDVKDAAGKRLKPYKKGQASFPESDGIHVPLSVDNEGRALRTGAAVLKYEDID
jgi:hypothetical protein